MAKANKINREKLLEDISRLEDWISSLKKELNNPFTTLQDIKDIIEWIKICSRRLSK